MDQNLKHTNDQIMKPRPSKENDDMREVDSYGEEEVKNDMISNEGGGMGGFGREPTQKEISQFEDEDWHDDIDGVPRQA